MAGKQSSGCLILQRAKNLKKLFLETKPAPHPHPFDYAQGRPALSLMEREYWIKTAEAINGVKEI